MSDVHTMPVRDLVPHDEARDCWCGPTVLRECPYCLPTGDCYVCGLTGFVEADEDAYLDVPCHVVHNAADGRP